MASSTPRHRPRVGSLAVGDVEGDPKVGSKAMGRPVKEEKDMTTEVTSRSRNHQRHEPDRWLTQAACGEDGYTTTFVPSDI
jgi:hypothetical protein